MKETEVVQGLEELKQTLATLPERMASDLVRAGMREGSKTIRRAIQSQAPIAKGRVPKQYGQAAGDLKRNIIIRSRRKKNILDFRVGVNDKAFYGRFVEAGHRHRRLPRNKTLAAIAHAIEVGDKSTPPHPFMRPAFEQSWRNALDQTASSIATRFDSLNITGGISTAEQALYDWVDEAFGV